MSKRILIVGAGSVGKAQISKILSIQGISESAVIFVEGDEDINQLIALRKNEVFHKIELQSMAEPHVDHINYQKQNSQQGWKNRSKHYR